MLKQILKRLDTQPVHTSLKQGGGDIYAAVLVPLVNDPDEPSIVLTKRSDNLSTHSGQVAFPGGKWDKTDSHLMATALRETFEEIDLHPSHVEVLAELPPHHTLQDTYVLPYVGLVPPDIQYVANPGELDAVFTVPVAYFLDKKNMSTFVFRHDGLERKMPCYHYQGYTIWGFTLSILTGLLNYTLDANLTLQYPPELAQYRKGKVSYKIA